MDHMLCWNDKVKQGTPITHGVTIHPVDFISFKDNYKDIYEKLVQEQILHPKEEKKRENLAKWKKNYDT